MNQTKLKIKSLKNIKIIEKQDKNMNDYYIIFNQDERKDDGTNEAYFCWKWTVKSGWEDFKANWTNIKEIEFEYQEMERGNKVINILFHDQSLDLFI